MLVLIYIGIGLGIAITGLCVPSFGRKIDSVAARIGMGIGYGRAVWFGGTVFAWPIGLYVLATGRLILVDTDPPAAADVDMESKSEEPLSTETGR